jgi:hypothetical protein
MKLFKRKTQNDNEHPRERQPYQGAGATNLGRNRAYSYHAKRSDDDANVGRDIVNPPVHASSKPGPVARVFRRLVLLAVLFVVLGLVVNMLRLGSQPKVVALYTPTSKVFLQNPTVYQQAAASFFTNFTNRNKLTINTNEISASMLKQFPELSAVSVTLPIVGHQAIIYIQPSEPSMILDLPQGKSYLLDGNGKALIIASMQDKQLSNLQIPTLQDQSDINVVLGQTALPTTTVTFIKTVAEQLSAQHIEFNRMLLPQATSELDVYIAGQSFFVKFNTESDSALQQAGTFIATYKHLKAAGITPAQYIDVRVDGRAYYK